MEDMKTFKRYRRRSWRANGKIVKVIIETVLLTDDEKVKASELAKAAGADFVKTSTGFAGEALHQKM